MRSYAPKRAGPRTEKDERYFLQRKARQRRRSLLIIFAIVFTCTVCMQGISVFLAFLPHIRPSTAERHGMAELGVLGDWATGLSA